MPTPDPSASLTAYQAWHVSMAGYAVETVSTLAVVGVTGLALVLFLLAIVAVQVYRP